MRLLFLSNFYPPLELGGMEQVAHEVTDAFLARGHDVLVLTSRHGAVDGPGDPRHVLRRLHLESDVYYYKPADFFLRQAAHDRENAEILANTLELHGPDAVMVWGMWQLNPQLALQAERLMRGRVAYWVASYWALHELEPDPHTAYWAQPAAGWKGAVKAPLSGLALAQLRRSRREKPKMVHTSFVSRFLLNAHTRAGYSTDKWRVIYNGIDVARFWSERSFPELPELPLRLLFAGTISRQKGAHTAVEAAALLAERHGPGTFRLDLVGPGHPDVIDDLKHFVEANDLAGLVTFKGKASRDAMPDILAQHDVLLFPSTWPEPLARMTMEGMASGAVVVTTTTGGTGEIVENGSNALTFEPDNAPQLAAQVERLLVEPGLAARVGRQGQVTARSRLDMSRMFDELEAFVLEVAG
jgi:glycosyltransferase involved in cell wall biosynthesis